MFCDYTQETGDECGRVATVKFVARDLARYGCEAHDVPMYHWLRKNEAPHSLIVSEFIPSAERPQQAPPVERCDKVGCFNLAERYVDLKGAWCHEHWAPWCEQGDCESPASFALQIDTSHDGYQPSENRYSCTRHLGDWANDFAIEWRNLRDVESGAIKLARIERPEAGA